jgi:hypothetical protein
MATILGASTQASASQSAITFVPSGFGAQVGDWVGTLSMWGNVTVTVPGSWTTVLNAMVGDRRVVIAHKILTATSSEQFTASGNSAVSALELWVTGTPGVDAHNYQTDVSATTATAPGVTTTEQAVLVGMFIGEANTANGFPVPTGMTAIGINQNGPNVPAARQFRQDFATPGATGDRTSTIPTSSAAERVGWLVAIRANFPAYWYVGTLGF